MKNLIQMLIICSLMLLPTLVIAQQQVTIRELNSYENIDLAGAPNVDALADSIQSHPLAGEEVQFTAVVVSYPRSSGLATPSDTDGDGTIDDISRIHVFVTDTTALTEGKKGMSIQLVESDWELLEGYNRGDVITVTATLSFFNNEAQLPVSDVMLEGNVNADFTEYQSLLDPIVVTADELNIFNANGNTHQVNIANYSDYNGSYVRLENATVSNVSIGDRPNWSVSNNGSRIYIYDTSLRYRNDRAEYLPNFNYRHGVDTEFQPPAPGSIVNINGFVGFAGDGDDPDGNVAEDQIAFSIRPFEDGVLWTGGQRFENGDVIPGVGTLEWPDDLEIIGAPPVVSNVALSDSTVTSSDAVTISATVVGAESDVSVTGVQLVYSASGVTETVDMTASGDEYSLTLPTFDNFTPVSFYFLSTDSDGLTGRNPIAGEYGFFVQDQEINSISLVQTTGDEGPGASPVAGVEGLRLNITGTIVSDFSDGVIILQDAAGPWSGVFLEQTTETESLVRGDIITITSANVFEAPVASNDLTLTQLTDIEFTLNSQNNDTEAVIPVLSTDEIVASTIDGELELYEGMLVKFDGVELVNRGRFGEYTLRDLNADSTDGAIFNEDIRSDDFVGTVGVPGDFNEYIRSGITMDAYAIVAASFGVPKFHPRNADDFITENGNAFTPVTEFNLGNPANGATVEVSGDITVDWAATQDYDGDDLTYEWVLYAAADTSVITTVSAESNTSVTLPYDTVDELLEGAGLDFGDTANFVWNVNVSDGLDTLGVTDDGDLLYRTLTLERVMATSNEVTDGLPKRFDLKQNFPNPFNPTTNIAFDLPQAADVKLNVYDMLGRRVATLVNERMTAGSQTINFDASNLASGMYIYRIQAGSYTSIKKMTLIK